MGGCVGVGVAVGVTVGCDELSPIALGDGLVPF